jgi:hypothetical protein
MTTIEQIKAEASGLGTRLGEWIEQLREADVIPDKDEIRHEAQKFLSGLTERLEGLPALVAENVPGYTPPRPKRGRLLIGIGLGAAAMYFFDPREGPARRRSVMKRFKGWFGGDRGHSGPTVEGYRPDAAVGVSN